MDRFVGKNSRVATILSLGRLSCAYSQDVLFSRTDSDREPHPNRGDSDKDKRSVEKRFLYRVSREADREETYQIVVRQRLKT